MRRSRRSRVGTNRQTVVNALVNALKADTKAMENLRSNNNKYVFGRLLNKWLNNKQESVIDVYVDEEAKEMVSYAINIVHAQIVKTELEMKPIKSKIIGLHFILATAKDINGRFYLKMDKELLEAALAEDNITYHSNEEYRWINIKYPDSCKQIIIQDI